jgi:hypothetical protein
MPVMSKTLSVNRLEWEHIQRVLTECGGNVSAAARRLGMHRRTLQRKLTDEIELDSGGTALYTIRAYRPGAIVVNWVSTARALIILDLTTQLS